MELKYQLCVHYKPQTDWLSTSVCVCIVLDFHFVQLIIMSKIDKRKSSFFHRPWGAFYTIFPSLLGVNDDILNNSKNNFSYQTLMDRPPRRTVFCDVQDAPRQKEGQVWSCVGWGVVWRQALIGWWGANDQRLLPQQRPAKLVLPLAVHLGGKVV